MRWNVYDVMVRVVVTSSSDQPVSSLHLFSCIVLIKCSKSLCLVWNVLTPTNTTLIKCSKGLCLVWNVLTPTNTTLIKCSKSLCLVWNVLTQTDRLTVNVMQSKTSLTRVLTPTNIQLIQLMWCRVKHYRLTLLCQWLLDIGKGILCLKTHPVQLSGVSRWHSG